MMGDNKERRVALYIRIASSNQLDQPSISIQEAQLRQYAARQGYAAPLVYADEGQKGLSIERPALGRLIADIENGKVGKVLVRDTARISRSYAHFLDFIETLEKNGATLDALDDPCVPHWIKACQAPHMMKKTGRDSKDRER
jgi:DNA invertase Pin-like site-specific DNA recombinase